MFGMSKERFDTAKWVTVAILLVGVIVRQALLDNTQTHITKTTAENVAKLTVLYENMELRIRKVEADQAREAAVWNERWTRIERTLREGTLRQ